ncbi:hypothetical protein PINS_up020347 [Pythium insidiosum]|nr:hypothetical protein PINS_up020347 [Pythium insidiosum]
MSPPRELLAEPVDNDTSPELAPSALDTRTGPLDVDPLPLATLTPPPTVLELLPPDTDTPPPVEPAPPDSDRDPPVPDELAPPDTDAAPPSVNAAPPDTDTLPPLCCCDSAAPTDTIRTRRSR